MPRGTSSRAKRAPERTTAGDPMIAGVRVSHPDRVIFPDAGLTKLDLVRYYHSVSRWILPHLRAGR